ncbi:carbohydrate-binding protein [Streptosporangium sp. NPDC001559]|uniref:carbohydrate-binding protein n=1 Tax=Streptosporangium sp. NPDC001559 TaxID=3366187 RepID=UPI0036E3EE73
MKRSAIAALLAAAALGAIPYGAQPATAEVAHHAVGIQAWQVGRSCNVGDLYYYEGHVYRCLASHTCNLSWAPPNTPGLWQLVG